MAWTNLLVPPRQDSKILGNIIVMCKTKTVDY